ncbi:hypothetical protein D3C73_1286340 [compost metagenome]
MLNITLTSVFADIIMNCPLFQIPGCLQYRHLGLLVDPVVCSCKITGFARSNLVRIHTGVGLAQISAGLIIDAKG